MTNMGLFRMGQKLLLSSAVLLLTSCGSGTNNAPQVVESPIPPPKGLLVSAENEAEFLDLFSLSIIEDGEDYLNKRGTVEVASSAEDSGRSFTTTYTLEASVDEHDVVKYDGDHLFIAPSRSMDCCFVMEAVSPVATDQSEGDSDNTSEEQRGIRILSTDPKQGTAALVSVIPVEGDLTVEGLYNKESKLVSLRSSSWWGTFGDRFSTSWAWEGQTSALDIYDISAPEQPELKLQIEIQGGFVTSRRVDDTVYMVARHTPTIEGLIRYPSTQEEIEENKLLLSDLTIVDVLPTALVNGESRLLLEADQCLFMDKTNEQASDRYGFPVMTFVIAVDLESESMLSASCYMGSVSGVYASENAIYLSQTEDYDEESRTLVHSYELSDSLSYQGSGVVEGHLWGRGEVDFRISEYGGYLRLVTTTQAGPWGSDDSINHRLSMLKLSKAELKLNLVASLPNANRPEKIGKPNESLYGVRFFGDKLYLVTFETIDPLYVLDLSDPEDPLIAGELTIPGFSDFLHPVNDDLLLGLGADEQGLVKLELFNVSDISVPFSLGTHVLGDGSWSYSEARYNRHAFTYQQYNESIDRFAVPLTVYGKEQDDYYQQNRLYMLELAGKDSPAVASIVEVGHITSMTDNGWSSGPHRSVFDGDAVYFIDGTSVYSTLWSNPLEQVGPF
jgi:uncharacterized secreted protein with C-terminal beta-propeller domain